MKPAVVAAGGLLALVALVAAGRPSPLSQTSGGLWEVTGGPARAPIRQCIADTRLLAQFEHRGEACPRTLISQSGDMATYQYNCPSGGFGRSDVTVITPRSLRIDTQGISGGLPFHYVIQARRVGDCRPH